MTEFAGNLANELSNIVTVAYGNISLLEPIAETNEASRIAYAGAKRAMVRSIGVIDRLRTVAGLQTMLPETVDIAGEIEAIVDTARATLPLSVHIRTNLGRSHYQASIDRIRFRDTLGELLSNATDALGRGGTLTISVGTARQNNTPYVRIDVRDTGTGMEAALLERATLPLMTTKPHPAHKGWGLALCEGFTRQSGGYMEINSVRAAQTGPSGTCVSLYLPRVHTLSAHQTPSRPAPAAGDKY